MFDCSGFSEDNFNGFSMKLFNYYTNNKSPEEYKQKLLNHINTVGNEQMDKEKLQIVSLLAKNSD